MQVSATASPAASTDSDTVAVGVFEGEDLPAQAPAELGELLASGEARPSFKALGLTHADGKRWLLVGLGARADFTPERARVAAAAACERASEISTRTLCWEVPRDSDAAVAEALVQGTILRDYHFERHKSTPADEQGSAAEAASKRLEGLIVSAPGASEATVAEAALLASAVNDARDLQNRPGNDLTPTALAEHAIALGKEIDALSVEVEGRDGIVGRGMGAFAAVAQGSD